MPDNRLIHELSPYLLQHAHNPVDWYPWGEEAFERAKRENKPVLVSIGYAACHWCHVMERESFENEEIAGYMNEQFICIKVDREEHPDVDHMYMDAVQGMSGSGGWPLNVFVTPEKIPFYGGTYFPPKPAYNRPSWIQLLQWVSQMWSEQNEDVRAQAQQMYSYLVQASKAGSAGNASIIDAELCIKIRDSLLKQADTVNGGFGAAPKFPGSMAISYLLEHYNFTKHEPSLAQALLSLDAMIKGGIYDQLGGGFARYSTDNKWLAPHFEKMLYDNALIICALADAYSITKESRFKVVIDETIAFVERELKEPSGGYYSALDADSEGVEGKFYTWTWEEWKAAVGDGYEMAENYFGISEKGNWEETNILHVAGDINEVAEKYGMSVEAALTLIQSVKRRLLAVRDQRIRPMTDDKSLLSWNALMNTALSKAGIALGNPAYIEKARAHMEWMLTHFEKEGEMLRTWKKGAARIAANLDDNAYLVQALLHLASASGDNKMVLKAARISETILRDFSQDDGPMFYYTSREQKDIPVRKVDIYDGATPSANAVVAGNLQILGMCMERSDWVERSGMMLQKMADTVMRYSYSFGYWATLLQRSVGGFKLVVCAGSSAALKTKELQGYFLPQSYIVTSEKEISELPALENKFLGGKVSIFVCTEQACLAPESETERVLQLIMQER